MRLIFEVHTTLPKLRVRHFDIGDIEIEDRARVIELRPFRLVEHQANAAAVEEGQVPSLEQELQPERLAVKSGSPLYIMHVDSDLPDRGKRYAGRCAHSVPPDCTAGKTRHTSSGYTRRSLVETGLAPSPM